MLKSFLSVLLMLSLCSCGRRDGLKITPNNWDANFEKAKPVILTGAWQNAENSWMKLRVSQDGLSEVQLHEWIKLQIQILQETQTDPLKEEIRVLAAQELGRYPALSFQYLPWLTNSLATNYFNERNVREKVEQISKTLEKASSAQRPK